jgi:DNA/RNA endonuclease YhcR with UshA esterase domain
MFFAGMRNIAGFRINCTKALGGQQMKKLLVVMAAASALFSATMAVAADKVSDVTKDKMGSSVTLEGTASGFKASRGEKSPNSFMLKDATGETRIVIWPDTYGKIAGKEGLEKDGAKVTVTGEVAEYREKVEVHVKDAAGVKVTGGAAAGATSTSGTATASTPATK